MGWCHSAGATPSGSQYESASPTRFGEGDATPPSNDRRNSLLMRSGGSVNSSFSDTVGGRPKSMPDRRANTLKKRVSVLSDKRANPDFFRKLEGVRDSIDWQIDIAVPRDSPQEVSSPRACGVASSESLVYNCTVAIPGSAPSANDDGEALCPEEGNGTDDLHYDQEEGGQLNPPAENGKIASENHSCFCSTSFTFKAPQYR